MSAARHIVVQGRPAMAGDGRPIEMCEHKGIGHPDTIADGACEAAARALASAYEESFGRVLHFNVDKGLLVAGKSEPRFGGGIMLEPAKLIICGRATPCPATFDVQEVAFVAVNDFLRSSLRADPTMFQVIPEIKPGSANLAGVVASGRAVVANDTSFGVGFAPYSRLERQVLEMAALLRSDEFRQQFPAAGDDFKIMGLRQHDVCRFTVALAIIDRHVSGVAEYLETRDAIATCLARALADGSVLELNCLDDPNAHDESGLYLTVTGLSAEMGDDGQVGRGNRVNGLITPNRPMSLEAAAGKNPVSHVGKIYNVLAHAIAHDVSRSIEGVGQVEVQLLSTIGRALDQPQLALVELAPGTALSPAARHQIDRLVNAWFDRIGEVSADLVHGRGHPVY